MRLKATRGLTYSTRRLQAGDEFDASDRDARVLIAIKKAQKMRDPVAIAAPPPAVAEKIAQAVAPVRKPTTFIEEPYAGESPPAGTQFRAPLPGAVVPGDLAAARTEYERVTGKRAFNGWDLATLQEKIAAAKTAA